MSLARRSFTAALTAVGAISIVFIINSPASTGQAPTCLGADAGVVGDPDGDGTVAGTPDADVIVGTEGNDVIKGGPGDDRICGLGGNDTITGDDGFDRVDGGAGDDSCDTERALRCENVTGSDPTPAPKPPKGGTTSSTMQGGTTSSTR